MDVFSTVLDFLASVKVLDAQLRHLTPGGESQTFELPHEIEIAGKKLSNGTVPHYEIVGVEVRRKN